MGKCRHCQSDLEEILDLGNHPLANRLLKSSTENEKTYSLKFLYCHDCGLYQVPTLPSEEIFDREYPYQSSINMSYVHQCGEWAQKFLQAQPHFKNVLEIGCNDGYMLQYFKHLPHLGLEPCDSVAELARKKGLNVETKFFTANWACVHPDSFDLIIANNVLAHVPHINDFLTGISTALSTDGVFVFEIPYVKNLIDQLQFDTIYHEHYSYFSKNSLIKIFSKFELKIIHINEIPSHGGSLRCYATHEKNKSVDKVVTAVEDWTHSHFKKSIQIEKYRWLEFLSRTKIQGKSLAAFGAAAKGVTFLNYIGIDSDFIEFCVDETPLKQGKFMPGSKIPIAGMDEFKKFQPDNILILPWNFKKEISEKLKFTKVWNCGLLSR